MRVIEASANAPPATLVFVKTSIPQEVKEVKFDARLVALQALADLVGMHISRIRRYGSGHSQPTLDAIRNLAVALSVSGDIGKDERGPDDELRLQFEAASRLNPEEKNVIRSVIESFVLRNTVRASERRFSPLESTGGSR